MRIIALVRKDLQRVLGDRRALFVNLALPLVLTFIIGLSFGGGFLGSGGGISAIPVVMVSEELPALLTERITEGLEESGFFTVSWADSSTADALVREGTAAAAVVLPQDLVERFFSAENLVIEVWKDPGSALKAGIVEEILRRALTRYQAGEAAYRALWPDEEMAQVGDAEARIWRNLLDGNFTEVWENWRSARGDTTFTAAAERMALTMDRHAALSRAMGETRITLAVADKAPAGQTDDDGQVNLFNFFLPSFSVFFLMFSVAGSCRDIHRERTTGTLQRQLLSPLGDLEFMLAKWSSAVVQAVFQLLVLFLSGALLFRVNLGPDIWSLPLAVLTCCTAGVGVFMLLALLSRTEKIMDNLSTVVVLVSAMLGGNMMPIDAMPAWLRAVGHYVFNYWANLSFHNIMAQDTGIAADPQPVLVLAVVSLILLAVNLLLFRSRVRRGGLA